ncbi:MAG TPA: hypothetical protein VK996_10195 [Ramlibacter sp.]|nr:hypothetical protein [Ramlibacter sp.]
MKALLATLLIAATPALVLAQSTTPAKPAAKPAARPAAKPAPKKPSAEQIKAAEEATPLEEPDPTIKLSEADLAVAKKVYVGDIACELGATVKIKPLRRDGFFLVSVKLNRFVMHPVESKTGAIRLEDPARGAMWLQLGNKSMLMSQKLGQRLADECQSPEQLTYAETLKKNPLPSILEPLPSGPTATTTSPGPN